MLSDGVQITIGGREFDLVLNTEALAQIAAKWGGLDKINDMLDGDYSEKIKFVPDLIALLATQGEAIKGSDEIIDPAFIRRHSFPRDFKEFTNKFIEAIKIGMNIDVDIPENPEGTDEVLAEIRKNGESATGN